MNKKKAYETIAKLNKKPIDIGYRKNAIQKLQNQPSWDLIIIGGGATGLGIAVDAASRGYTTLLLEQSDFAKGTSSRSTKLVHGGVRYLEQAKIGLVFTALHERGILLKNAPHIVKRQSFIIPCYSQWEKYKYLIGLKAYDWLSGSFSFGKSTFLNRKEIKAILPELKTGQLTGGVQYFDGQFDDARLAINLAQTCIEMDGVALNYFKVNGLIKKEGKVNGVFAMDVETNRPFQLLAKSVINATGVFVDDILKMDVPECKSIVQPSQGVHLVFDKSFLNGNEALMIPKTTDGRVLFAIPWYQHVLVGTTDTPIQTHSLEPKALNDEIEFILQTIRKYLIKQPTRKDVLSVFAGLRPLAASENELDSTKEISRDHKLFVSASNLITITGGKWTTYRKMAEETVNKAILVAGMVPQDCITKLLPIHGNTNKYSADESLSIYGSDAEEIKNLINENPFLNKKIIEGLSYTEAEVVWAVRHEMARMVEDVLARRLRLLFLDAAAAIEAAPKVAEIMAGELGYDEKWQRQQVESFNALANTYLLENKNFEALAS